MTNLKLDKLMRIRLPERFRRSRATFICFYLDKKINKRNYCGEIWFEGRQKCNWSL